MVFCKIGFAFSFHLSLFLLLLLRKMLLLFDLMRRWSEQKCVVFAHFLFNTTLLLTTPCMWTVMRKHFHRVVTVTFFSPYTFSSFRIPFSNAINKWIEKASATVSLIPIKCVYLSKFCGINRPRSHSLKIIIFCVFQPRIENQNRAEFIIDICDCWLDFRIWVKVVQQENSDVFTNTHMDRNAVESNKRKEKE